MSPQETTNKEPLPAKARSSEKSKRRGQGGPPPLDAETLARVVHRVEIQNVELMAAVFDPANPAGGPDQPPAAPVSGINVAWHQDEPTELVCVITFAILIGHADSPFRLISKFRLTYGVAKGKKLTRSELEQFAHWNAMFNAWPYWREFVGSIASRAGLPQVVLPVMRVPVPDSGEPAKL